MERRAFLNISGLALGTMLVPVMGRAVAARNRRLQRVVGLRGTAHSGGQQGSQYQ